MCGKMQVMLWLLMRKFMTYLVCGWWSSHQLSHSLPELKLPLIVLYLFFSLCSLRSGLYYAATCEARRSCKLPLLYHEFVCACIFLEITRIMTKTLLLKFSHLDTVCDAWCCMTNLDNLSNKNSIDQNLDNQVLAKQHKPKLGQPSFGKQKRKPKLGQPSLGKNKNKPKLGQPSLGKTT